jgi:CBS domain containing-hemolysin-like protein
MLLASGIITLLILLTALFVAAEFAVVGARRSRLRRLAEDGSPLAARVLPVLEDPHALDRYIAASQVGITLSSRSRRVSPHSSNVSPDSILKLRLPRPPSSSC